MRRFAGVWPIATLEPSTCSWGDTRSVAYRLAWSIVRDPEEARDLSQEAFLRLYEAAGSFDGRARFSTWFYRILVNLCLDRQRTHRWWRGLLAGSPSAVATRDGLLERQPAPPRDPLDRLDREQVLSELWAAVSPHQRAALLLQVRERLSKLLPDLGTAAPQPPEIRWDAYNAELRDLESRRASAGRWAWLRGPVAVSVAAALVAVLAILLVQSPLDRSRVQSEFASLEETPSGAPGRL